MRLISSRFYLYWIQWTKRRDKCFSHEMM